MRLGIFQTGRAPDELRQDFGDYDLFFQRLLGEETFDYVTYPVVDDEIKAHGSGADDAQIACARTSAEINDFLKAN